MQLLSYFGENWDALNDCLNDLDWLGGGAYLLMITDADQMLADEGPREARILRSQLQDAHTQRGIPVSDGRGLERPAVSFRTVLHVADHATAEKLMNRLGVG